MCGENWLKVYLDTLPEECFLQGLEEEESLKAFKFGDGEVYEC